MPYFIGISTPETHGANLGPGQTQAVNLGLPRLTSGLYTEYHEEWRPRPQCFISWAVGRSMRVGTQNYTGYRELSSSSNLTIHLLLLAERSHFFAMELRSPILSTKKTRVCKVTFSSTLWHSSIIMLSGGEQWCDMGKTAFSLESHILGSHLLSFFLPSGGMI